MRPSHRKQGDSDTQEVFKVHLLQDESISRLYKNRLMGELFSTRTTEEIYMEWNTTKTYFVKAALETIGKRKQRRGAPKYLELFD